MEEEKEKHLKKLLKSASGIKILSEKLSLIISDKEFYKYGLLTQIIEVLIKNGYGNVVLDNFSSILNNSLKDEVLEIVTMIAEIPGGEQTLVSNIKITRTYQKRHLSQENQSYLIQI